jgi:hypothetical protein
VSSTVRIKACGGLAPFSWTIIGPATLGAATGVANSVTCVPGTQDPSPIIVTVTDAARVSVSNIISGTCACASECSGLNQNTSTQCPSDYMSYYYNGDDVVLSNSPLELLFWSGDGACAGGSTTRWALAAAGGHTMDVNTVNSGGFMLYYGTLNPNQIGASGKTANAHSFALKNFSFPVLANIVGTPSFGIAVNCAEGNTCNNFSGLVLLFDYPTNSVILGQYTNADIGAGVYPTTIGTMTTIPSLSDLNEIVLQNGFKSGGNRVVEVFMNGLVAYTFANETTLDVPLVSPRAGYGVFWLKSAALASFRMHYDDNTLATLTFVD